MGKIFNIGFPLCGEDHVLQMLQYQGLSCTGLYSKAAEDVCFSIVSGKKPLSNFASKRYFSLLENGRWMTGALFKSQFLYEFLDSNFPNSCFVLLDRNESDWLESLRQSKYLDLLSFHYGRTGNDLLGFLSSERKKHIQCVRSYFGGGGQLFEADVFEEGVASLVQRMQSSGWLKLKENGSNLKYNNVLESDGESSQEVGSHFFDAVKKVSDFCVPEISLRKTKSASFSNIYAQWCPLSDTVEGKGKVFLGKDGGFYCDPNKHWKFRRVSAVLNEVASFKPSSLIRVDMQDGRNYGIEGVSDIDGPVVTYCRRAGSKNIVLWPLPGYHTIGSPRFIDRVGGEYQSFADKKDLAVWRGALSGHCSDVFNNVLSEPTHMVVKKIIEAGVTSGEAKAYWSKLENNIRFSFCSSFHYSADIDAYIVLAPKMKSLESHPEYSSIFAEKASPEWILSHKYIVCLRGYDTSSNFLMAAASNSLALKEEDDWEVFYSCLFKPWVHYIPLSPGGMDICDKLEWARNNQDKCKSMIVEAQKSCKLLMRSDFMSLFKREVVRKLDEREG